MQKWQIHFHSPAKIHIFYITKNKCLLRFHNINIFNTYRGGTSRGCTCLRSALPLARARSAPTKLLVHFLQGVQLSQLHQPS